MRASENAVLVYDGTCGFCSRTVQFILRHERAHTLRFASLESACARDARQRYPELRGVDSVVWLDAAQGTVLTKSAAILRLARYLGGAWRVAEVGWIVPGAIRDRAYDLVARHRHALTGEAESCFVPDPPVRDRFLDDPR